MTTTYKVTVDEDGVTRWFFNFKLHRNDGPAYTSRLGDKAWFQDGEYHREDGPAIEYANGDKSWYLNGNMYSEDEFNDRMNPVELTVADIEKLLGHRVKVVK